MRPPWTQLIDVLAQLFDNLERCTLEEFTQELRRSGSGPGERKILPNKEKKQQCLLAGEFRCLEDHNGFIQSDRPFAA